MLIATVGYFVRGRGKHLEVYLGEKTRKICKGKLIGPGGKCEGKETLEECVVREIKEEVGIKVKQSDSLRVAMIDYYDTEINGEVGKCQRVGYFLIRRWRGKFKSNGDLKNLRWRKAHQVPPKRMMLGHSLWFYLIMSGHCAKGTIRFSKGRKAIRSVDIRIGKLAQDLRKAR